MKQKLFSMLALLLVAVSGAWAQSYTVKFEGHGRSTTKTVTLPHTFSCDGKNGELADIIIYLRNIATGYFYSHGDAAPNASGNSNVTAGKNGSNYYITISAPLRGHGHGVWCF